MYLEVEDNPNCSGSGGFVFNELETTRPIQGIRVGKTGEETRADVVGVDGQGKFVQAYAVKITDSGAGYAYAIYGGDWGIRIRPSAHQNEPWDLNNANQWGEPFKIYGSPDDILYL